jgi:hypothetical protein
VYLVNGGPYRHEIWCHICGPLGAAPMDAFNGLDTDRVDTIIEAHLDGCSLG